MPGIDDLAPDQRAVLQLVLGQGRGYAELAGLLRSEPDALRARAVGALETLVPPPAGAELPPADRATVTDWLLGQGDGAAAEGLLRSSPAARAWAQEARGAVAPLAGTRPLPAVPAPVAAPPAAPEPELEPDPEVELDAPPPPPPAPAPALSADPVAEPPAAVAADGAPARPRASRLGGALLLGGLALVAAVAVVLVLSLGGDDDDGGDADGTASTTPARTTATTDAQARVLAQANLLPPGGRAGGDRLGVAQVIEVSGQRALRFGAQGLSPSSSTRAYGVWVQGGERGSLFLGFPEARVGQNGRLQFVNALEPDLTRYRTILLTSEDVAGGTPTSPGEVVLRGSIRRAGS